MSAGGQFRGPRAQGAQGAGAGGPEGAAVVPTLADVCVRTLCDFTRFLGDVGFLPDQQLRRVLAHCGRAELAAVEDATREGSARDLSWSTWHLWRNVFASRYSAPAEGELVPLPGDPPFDYEPPPGVAHPPADYRRMVQLREEGEAARKQAAVARLRAGYAADAADKLQHGVEFTAKLPPPKRARLSKSPAAAAARQLAAANAGRTLGGKSATKVLSDLGLAARPPGAGSRPAKCNKGSGVALLGRGRASPSAAALGRRQQQQQQGSRPAQAPSALACLARPKGGPAATGRPAAAAAASSTAAGRPAFASPPLPPKLQAQGSSQLRAQHQPQPPARRPPQQLQQQRAGGMPGKVPPGAAAAASSPRGLQAAAAGAAAAWRPQGEKHGLSGSKRSETASGLLDTPVVLGARR